MPKGRQLLLCSENNSCHLFYSFARGLVARLETSEKCNSVRRTELPKSWSFLSASNNYTDSKKKVYMRKIENFCENIYLNPDISGTK